MLKTLKYFIKKQMIIPKCSDWEQNKLSSAQVEVLRSIQISISAPIQVLRFKLNFY